MFTKNNISRIIFIFAIIVASFGIGYFASASGYDIYVDQGYEGEDSDGSSSKPYRTIEKAIEESPSKGKKIYVKNGTYEERLTLSKGIELYGQDKSKTVVKGTSGSITLTAKDDNLIKNLTVSGGSSAINIEGEGEISSCIIKDASKNAILITEGSAEVKVNGCKINSNGKGFYIQKGRKVSISENEISGNSEEGIDIREKVSGRISGNSIVGNGEGGIEMVLGGSNLTITGNQIKKNKASGIAAQFYSFASKTGKIEIKKNTVSGNGIYGIVCKTPSGGDPEKNYWDDSIDLTDNKIENNKGKSISGSCKLIKAVSEDEVKKNQTIESDGAKEISSTENYSEEEMEREAEEEREAKALLEKETYLNTLTEKISSDHKNSSSELSKEMEEARNKNRVKFFFLGIDYKKLGSVRENLEKIEKDKEILGQAIDGLGAEIVSGSKDKALEEKKEMEKTLASGETFIKEQQGKFSLFGWIFDIFQEKKVTISR